MKHSTVAKLAAMAALGALSQGAFAADGTINFTGEIVDAPCSIAPASQNLIVPMGRVSRPALDGAAGKRATPARFSIALRDCGATAKGATVSFTGATDATVKDLLRIANSGQVGAGSATGVAIELGDSAGTKIPVGAQSAVYTLGQGSNDLDFQAAYVSTGEAVTVGPANATAQFTVTYR